MRILPLFFSFLLITQAFAQLNPDQALERYRQNLTLLRQTWTNQQEMPNIPFFLFGMGDRRKFIYRNGTLLDAKTGDRIRQWKVKKEWIIPSEYWVRLETEDGKMVEIREDERMIYYSENRLKVILSQSQLHLPRFEDKKFGAVLRVLHHEILINVDEGKPVPNFLTYKKPWYRDATLMAMVLRETNNLNLIKNWILRIRDPFDRNNKGTSEVDNLGQVLFLLSLVTDANHPTVKNTLDSAKKFITSLSETNSFLKGKTDYAEHPVFQTKWMKYGLKSLELVDSYTIPKEFDSYSALFWWDYKNQHQSGQRFSEKDSKNYPYLRWAEDHFYGEKKGYVTNQDYPLSWEQNASEAWYSGMQLVDENLANQKIATPHTWHAAEMFLLLMDF